MRRYPLYILDLDGTLFRGNTPIPGAVDTVRTLRERGASIRFLTNNSTQTRVAFSDKLRGLGFEAHPHEVYSSAYGAAETLKGRVARAHVVGEPGLIQELASVGIVSAAENVQAVVVGLCRSFDYDALTQAMQPLLDPDVAFIATNRDATYPMEHGHLIPGAGAIVAALVTCSGREPTTIGKPEPYLIDRILEDAKLEPRDALVVGDRIDTDIEAGLRAGCPVHLVLSGVSQDAPEGTPASADVTAILQV